MISWGLLIVSVVVNIFCFLYIRFLIKSLTFFSANFKNLYSMLEDYILSLSGILELELFYDEPVLKNLMKNTTVVKEKILEFKEVYDLEDE